MCNVERMFGMFVAWLYEIVWSELCLSCQIKIVWSELFVVYSIIIYGPMKIKSKSKGNGRDAIYGPLEVKSKSKGNGRDAITYGPLQSSYMALWK